MKLTNYGPVYRDFGLFLSQEEVDIIRYITGWWCCWNNMPDSYSKEDAEADFKELDDKPEGMTVDMLHFVVNSLLERYKAENEN